ncbi:MAG: hypothetical protein LBJ90_09215 [Treponema sp.]|jgi:hypothetical protein|nr:hypothetical protein [Treponema sp.]
MLPREDFVFTIGYDGPVAVVDRQAKKRYGALSARELAEKGLFRAAYSSAVYSGNPEEMRAVIEIYNRISGVSLPPDYPLDRLFGVFPVDARHSIAL